MLWRIMAYEAFDSSRVRDTPLMTVEDFAFAVSFLKCARQLRQAHFVSRVTAVTAVGRSQPASPLAPWSRRIRHSGPPAGYEIRLPGSPRNVQIHLRRSAG